MSDKGNKDMERPHREKKQKVKKIVRMSKNQVEEESGIQMSEK